MNFKKSMTALMAVGMLAGCAGQPAASTAETDALFTAGTYTGTSANGRNGKVSVEVEFTSSEIKSVTVTEHEETPGIADPAISQIPEEIIAAQGLAVDVVSGATITSNAIIEAVADAAEQAGADVDALKQKTSDTVAHGEHQDMDATLVIVGGGAAGISAAVYAASNGYNNVVLLEKTGALGGNAIRSGGFIEDLKPTPDIALQMSDSYRKTLEDMLAEGPQDEDEKSVWDGLVQKYEAYKQSGSTEMFDCAEMLAIEYHRLEGSPVALNMPYADAIDEFTDWFTGEIGAKYGKMTAIVGYTWPRWTTVDGFAHGAGYFDYFEKYIENKKLDINIMLNTAATSLIVDDEGKVTGVEATDTKGNTYTISSENGVVLATGGFAANGEMLLKYDTQWGITTADTKTDNNPGVTGDGIVMAEAIGASISDMDNIMMFPMGASMEGSHASMVGIFNGSSNLMVNTSGKRFVDETASRFEICHAVFEQDGQFEYIITDAINSDSARYTEEEIQDSVDKGFIFRGDTIEELAQNMGIDPEVLKKTVDDYNESCRTSTDPEFGRTKYMEGSEIVQAPFYATKEYPVAHITIGGIDANGNGEVLDTEGNVIEGLYAAGETVSGYCGISAFAWGRKVSEYILNK